jgi:hypothetical protein
MGSIRPLSVIYCRMPGGTMFRKFLRNPKPDTRPGILVVSAPKTASTFVHHVLSRTLDLRASDVWRCEGASRRMLTHEVDLARAAEIRATSKPGIARAHLLPNPNTLLFLERSAMRPIIIWRRIEDCVVSLREEWERQWLSNLERVSAEGHSLQFLGIVPGAFVRAFLQASETEQHDLVIDLAVPWYCRFRSGWREVAAGGKLSIASVCYEALARDELSAIQSLLRQLGESVPDEIVGSHIAAIKANRFAANTNVGRSGRGHGLLTDTQRARIRQIMIPFGAADRAREAELTPPRPAPAARDTLIRLATRELWNAANDLRAGHPDVAVAGYERVLAILGQDSAADAENRDGWQCRLQALYGLAAALGRLGGRDVERQAALHAALEVLERLRALNPNDAALAALANQISLTASQAVPPKEGTDVAPGGMLPGEAPSP